MYRVEIDSYHGPLDLLLRLIEKKQLEVTEVALSSVTADFLGYVDQLEVEADQLNWFMQITSQLILIKSREIIAVEKDEVDDEEPNYNLADQLLRYRRYRDAAQLLTNRMKQPSYARPWRRETTSAGTIKLDPMTFRLSALKTRHRHSEYLRRKQRVTLQLTALPIMQQIDRIRSRLQQQGTLSVSDILAGQKTTPAKIAMFLAVLEILNTNSAVLVAEGTTLQWRN